MTTIIDYLSNLESMRENLATSKLRTGSMPYPAWMQISSLKRTYTEDQELLRTGKLHYAYLVQANTALCRSGSYDCPGNIVIGYSDYFDSFPKELGRIAHSLFEYKDRKGAPGDIKQITDAITNERSELFNVPVAPSLAHDFDVRFTTMMFFRSQMPKHRLILPLFPVLSDPERFQSALMLPKHYWTKEFIRHYCEK